MKILVINSNTIDISQMYTNITWSGSIDEFARKIEVEIIDPSKDSNIQNIKIEVGNRMKIFTDTEMEIFDGYIIDKEINSTSSTMRLACYDGLFYMLKSEVVKNYSKKTAEYIAKDICNIAQIPIGSIVETGVSQNYPANGTLIEVIKDAYDFASSINSKKYKIYSKSGKFYTEELGKKVVSYILKTDVNILSSTYSESLEEMANKIKIYDESGKVLGEIFNNEDIKKYGLIQKIYTKEDGKEFRTVAKNMLKGVGKKLNITALGNPDCITGSRIILENSDGQKVEFVIISDNHEFGLYHKMSLELELAK